MFDSLILQGQTSDSQNLSKAITLKKGLAIVLIQIRTLKEECPTMRAVAQTILYESSLHKWKAAIASPVARAGFVIQTQKTL